MLNYETCFKKNPLPMWFIRKTDEQILSVNNSAIETYGYSKKELLNRKFSDLFPEEDQKLFDNFFRQKINETTQFGIWRLKKSNGIIINVSIYCFTSHSSNGDGNKVLISTLPHEPKFIIPNGNGAAKPGIFQFITKETITTDELKWLKKIYNYVLNHIDENIKIEDLSYHLAQSTRTINRYCKSITGLSPYQLIQKIKFARAKLLWECGIINEKEKLAHKIGYKDSYYLIQKMNNLN
ncbi:MAG: PAS domain S-box protein [Balneolaceae bacterium]|nr:PAS domain S-box protein [Balneolaceae bacterium]